MSNVPDESLLPSRRRNLELEFHQWAKDTGARADVFNCIGWLQERGLMLSEQKQAMLNEVRREILSLGFPRLAAKIDEAIAK